MTPDSSLADIRGALDGLREQDPGLACEIEFPVRPERRINREVMAAAPVSQIVDCARVLAATLAEVCV